MGEELTTEEATREGLERLGFAAEDLVHAVIAFQWSRGLPATGELDGDTRQALDVALETAE